MRADANCDKMSQQSRNGVAILMMAHRKQAMPSDADML